MKLAKTAQMTVLTLLLSVQVLVHSNFMVSPELLASLAKKYDSEAKTRVQAWQSILKDYNQYNDLISTSERLDRVNQFFNSVEFKEDIDTWGQNDYWATPLEFLAKNAGDCEDFTIAKYVTLINIGIPDEKLRLMYVTATRPRQAHMVLAYYETPNAVPLVLDNITPRILPASQRRDLIPIYSFNGQGLWLAKEQGRGRKVQANGPNKLWLDLQKRMLEDLQL